MPFQGLFLDAAGTLFHLTEPVGATYARIAGEHALRCDPDVLDAAFRQAWKHHLAALHPNESATTDDDRSWWRTVVKSTFETVQRASIEDSLLDPLFAELYDHFAQPTAWRLFPDVPQALQRLADIAPLHILSNFDLRLHPILQGLGIAEHFQTITLSSQVGTSKPHPRIFTHALSQAGIPAHAALHIGDEREADLMGASQAGLYACLLDRPTFDLVALAEKLHSGDDSCLQAPLNGVLTRPQIERG
jgi:putative hydrolase of the HAD superfamily